MSVNPLISPALPQPVDSWAGVWIAEDIQLLGSAIKSGSWVDGVLGGVSAGLDGLSLLVDPVGNLLQYGIAWIIEHVKPLSQVLDLLAGDPAQIAGHIQTWKNTAQSLKTQASTYGDQVGFGLGSWVGDAREAYQVWSEGVQGSFQALSEACQTMAYATEVAGCLVSGVRMLVRDAIAVCVSRLAVYAAEEAMSLGFATPLVVGQVTATVLSCSAKVARWLRALAASLKNLMPLLHRLGELIAKLKDSIRRMVSGRGSAGSGPPPTGGSGLPVKPRRTPEEEAKRVHELGFDPATGRHRPVESDTAVLVEKHIGEELTRAPHGSKADWVDSSGRSYDAVGGFKGEYFDKQWPQLQYQIHRHLDKADFVPVDVSRFTPEQAAKVRKYVEENGLGPRVFIVP